MDYRPKYKIQNYKKDNIGENLDGFVFAADIFDGTPKS
jgi:hypothetical protein